MNDLFFIQYSHQFCRNMLAILVNIFLQDCVCKVVPAKPVELHWRWVMLFWDRNSFDDVDCCHISEQHGDNGLMDMPCSCGAMDASDCHCDDVEDYEE